MGSLLQDLRYAARALAASRGFTLVAVLTLALGIGANSAIFSVVDATLLRPLPFPDAGRLALVWMDNTRLGIRNDITSYPSFLDWRAGSRADFADLAGYFPRRANLSGAEGPPERLSAPWVGANFFRVLGVPPALGRPFRPEEEQPGKDGVVLLSDHVWRERFGADPRILGRTIRLNGSAREVVGVMPAGFDFPPETDVWVPLAPDADLRQSRGSFWLYVVGRLRPEGSLAGAQAALDVVAERNARERPDFRGYGVFVEPLRDHLVGDVRTGLWVLLGAVGFVLLIACANVANLLLARAASREREIAVRSALGAGRARVVRQLLTESLLLALAGGVLGLGAAFAGIRVLRAAAPAGLALPAGLGLDARVLGFTLLAALATGLLFGLAPALQLSRPRLAAALVERGAGAGTRRGRLVRRALVVAEVALALVLLVGAGLLVQSLARLSAVDPGFRPQSVVAVDVALAGEDYAEPARVRGFYDTLLARVAALPGVEAAGAITSVLLEELANSGNVTVEGQAPPPPEQRVEVTFDEVTPGFFRALGTPLLAGRGLAATDRDGTLPVCLANQAMARHFWPGEEAVGKRVKFGSADSPAPWITIVGVVGDARRTALEQEARASLFFPHAQYEARGMTVIARTRSDPHRLGREIAAAVRAIDRNQPVARISTLEEQLGERLSQRRWNALLLTLFSGLALLLAAVGVYGVVSYAVAQSRREIGIRMALGARAGTVLRQVLAQGLALVAVGLALGLLGALAVRRALASLLFGVTASDPATYAGVALVLLLVAAAASYLPARRAARTDPAVALRAE